MILLSLILLLIINAKNNFSLEQFLPLNRIHTFTTKQIYMKEGKTINQEVNRKTLKEDDRNVGL